MYGNAQSTQLIRDLAMYFFSLVMFCDGPAPLTQCKCPDLSEVLQGPRRGTQHHRAWAVDDTHFIVEPLETQVRA